LKFKLRDLSTKRKKNNHMKEEMSKKKKRERRLEENRVGSHPARGSKKIGEGNNPGGGKNFIKRSGTR